MRTHTRTHHIIVTFTTFLRSATWAFWNSPYNSHCGNTSWNGTGLCFEAFDNVTWDITQQLQALGVQPLPIVETCCVCVLNASYDFMPAMNKLIADAVDNDFIGYAVDMECGGAEPEVRLRSMAFLDAFGNAMRAINKTVSCKAHIARHAELSPA